MKIIDLKSHIVAVPIKKLTYVLSSDEDIWRVAVIYDRFQNYRKNFPN